MDTDRLRFFCTISETGSLSKAAEILNISHSGLSKAMSVLQDETGIRLLRPLGRGIELTEAGRQFYKKSKLVLDMLEDLTKPVEHKRTVRIGLAEIFSVGVTGPLARELGHNAEFFEYDAGQSEIQVLNNEIDFAVTCVPYPHIDLEYFKIKRIHMGAYTTNLSFLKRPLEEVPFVVPSHTMRDNPLSLRSGDGWPSDVPRFRGYGVGSLAGGLSVVDLGMAVVFIPEFVARHLNAKRDASNRLHALELPKRIINSSARDIFLLSKKGAEETPEMKSVIKLVRNLC